MRLAIWSSHAVFIVRAILSHAETTIPESALTSMVLSDDECLNTGTTDCALNAIQVQGSRQTTAEREEAGFCKICHSTCQDHATYGLLEQCNAEPMCHLLDAAELNRNSTCVCAQESCKGVGSLQLGNEDSSDDSGASDDLGASFTRGCRRRRYCSHAGGGSCAQFGCGGGYVRWRGCQCNQDCEKHGSCCSDYHQKCSRTPSPPPQASHSSNIKTLYHTTSRGIANLILNSNFKPGSQGWCGGAVYFMDYPGLPKSKEDPLTTQRGAIVEARVDLGKVCQSTRNKNCRESRRGTCCPMLGGGHGIQGAAAAGCGSILWNPGDGNEYVIWDTRRILSRKIYSR